MTSAHENLKYFYYFYAKTRSFLPRNSRILICLLSVNFTTNLGYTILVLFPFDDPRLSISGRA